MRCNTKPRRCLNRDMEKWLFGNTIALVVIIPLVGANHETEKRTEKKQNNMDHINAF